MGKLQLSPALRLLSAAAGAALVVAGLRRRSLVDAGLGFGGVSLLYWAVAAPSRETNPEQEMDIVDIASEESFPASDAPAW